MEQLKIEDLRNEIMKGLNDDYQGRTIDFINDELENQGMNEDLGDIIASWSDENVDIYYADLLEWFNDNWDIVDDAIKELGHTDSVMNDIRQGEYYQISNELYDNADKIIEVFTLNHLLENGIIEIGKDTIEKIYKEVKEMSNFEEIRTYLNDKSYLEN